MEDKQYEQAAREVAVLVDQAGLTPQDALDIIAESWCLAADSRQVVEDIYLEAMIGQEDYEQSMY